MFFLWVSLWRSVTVFLLASLRVQFLKIYGVRVQAGAVAGDNEQPAPASSAQSSRPTARVSTSRI